ncbi:MAG: cytochrome c oxidase subunit 3 [Rhodobacteraceae bacterium]|nr:cytochrome c oxidase subunit 3 [Paracoccaceae bacterium]
MAEAHNKHHDYHLVDPSPWPFLVSMSVFVMALGGIGFMKLSSGASFDLFGVDLAGWKLFAVGFVGVVIISSLWWRDTIKEAHEGHHTRVVSLHLRYGMLLFIASEVMFFVAWFWAYFDAALFADEAIQVSRVAFTGGVWPPEGIETFDPWHLPLFNTLILLASGTSVTWAHHALLHDDREGLKWGLIVTVILGLVFSICQAYEYSHATFELGGHIYGATFYVATGFHGFHVIVGTIFLAVCLFRALAGHFTKEQHFGFEAAAWYWHFVDVVWIFLFVAIYIWGAGTPSVH